MTYKMNRFILSKEKIGQSVNSLRSGGSVNSDR